MCKPFTLRDKIEDTKAYYMEHYGQLNWQWYDEGVPYTIQDYHSGKGSIWDFTADDVAVLAENGWTLSEAAELCDEEYDPVSAFVSYIRENFPIPMQNHFTYDLLYNSVHWVCTQYGTGKDAADILFTIVPEINRSDVERFFREE